MLTSPRSKPVSMRNPINSFVIIDDDSCHNIVCALSIKKIFKSANINITGFSSVHQGIEHLKSQLSKKGTKTVLFLDINMPYLSGWQVLQTFDAMGEEVKNNLIVYMLSSSLTMYDKARSFSFSFVKDCLEKPLSDHLIHISEELTEIALMEELYA